jgi:hypothetical protein
MSDSIIAVRKENKGIPNVMSCELNLHIAKATADYKWTGKKMPQDLWWQICAFFEWTYETCKSESQVRLFVNSVTGEWAAWAFPQERNTGMTTKELPDHPQFAIDRQRFNDDWYYYGTVHHHCSMGAFQSGTDEENEKGQDGIHITVGKMGEVRYDVDIRVYQSRWKLPPPDMSMFWDIGSARLIVPEELHNTVARYQMTFPPPKDHAFPEEWKANYLVPPPPPVSQKVTQTHQPYGTSHWTNQSTARQFQMDRDRTPPDTSYDLRLACGQMLEWVDNHKDPRVTYNSIQNVLDAMAADDGIMEICRLLWIHDITPKGFSTQWDESVLDHELKLENEANEKRSAPAGNGNGAGNGATTSGVSTTEDGLKEQLKKMEEEGKAQIHEDWRHRMD